MNEKKFTEVFNKYNRLVRKMVISRSGNDMLAEEICQQVFLQYFEQMNKQHLRRVDSAMAFADNKKYGL